MNTVKQSMVLALVALLALVAFVGSQPAAAVDGGPTNIPGNPSCADLGYEFGFKPQPEPPPSGTYTFPDGINEVTINSDGIYFDWISTLGIDAVIVKGGSNASVYQYDPPEEAFEDFGLRSPINPNNNSPYAISHIEFCYDYEVDVAKDANTSFTRTYEWDITKEFDGEYWLFVGDSATHDYKVSVNQTGYTDSDFAVAGTITIENNTPFDANITGVSDTMLEGIVAPVDCGVPFPYTLPAGESLSCGYGVSLPFGFNGINTAIVTTEGLVGGGEATADVIFGEPTTEVNAEVTVEDTFDGQTTTLGTATGGQDFPYDREFSCPADLSLYVDGHYMFSKDNTATIVETGQSDDASVTVHCYTPLVSKDAQTSFTRTWNWTIDKVADQTDLILSPGQQFLVNYGVTVDAASVDSEFAVTGTITVFNPNPKADMTVSLADEVSGGIAANLACGGALTVPAGGSATCDYNADLPDSSDRLNTATATLNAISFAGTADVAFDLNNPTQELDEVIEVSDTNVGFLGTVSASDAPKTFTYSLTVGPFVEPDDCGDHYLPNVASFSTNDSGSTGEDSWTVHVYVPCDLGCSLTPGYWKTHSGYGPAPYDETWAFIGEDTLFFLSGQSYYDVLWTSPKGNAYYILAHAYIAAELNELNGADFSAAQTAFDDATSLFETYTPDEVAALKGQAGNELRAQFIELAEILDNYNNGLIGPGHCSE